MTSAGAVRSTYGGGSFQPASLARTHRDAGEKPGFSRFRASFDSGLSQKWQVELMQKVIDCTELPAGWDGYAAQPVRRDAAMFGLQVLQSIMLPRTPMPAVVPSPTGIQFEWHERGIDLEMHVTAPYEWEIWFHDHTGDEPELSTELSNDFSLARKAVATLTRR